MDTDQLVLLANHPPPALLDPGDGAIIGPLYRRGDSRAQHQLHASARKAIAGSAGNHLVQAYWGSYVAVLTDTGRSRVVIVRAPMGALPLYWLTAPQGTIFGSDLGLLRRVSPQAPSIDRAALARFLVANNVRTEQTCLKGLSEVQGGQRLIVQGERIETEAVWSPWLAAARDRQLLDPREAIDRVRDTVLHTVAAFSSAHARVLLKLSGGLDSSIVAAALCEAGRGFDCLTLVTPNPSGDERHFAAMTAQATGAMLIERMRDPALVDLGHSEARDLPRPTMRGFMQASRSIAASVATDTGASAILDGSGGDGVFCSLQSIRPVLDCLRAPEGRPALRQVVRDLARVSQSSMPHVAWRTLLALRRSPIYRIVRDDRFLSPAARALSAGAGDHPWLVLPHDALPAKAAHVAMIVTAQSVAEAADPLDPIPTLSPLMAQPVVETCLQVPSWLWLGNGSNRAVARHAFADRLPAEIAWRRSKGTPDSFLIELYETQRPHIRRLLLDGVLRDLGLLDTDALMRVFDDLRPVIGYDFVRVMRLVDIETWARSV
ncbi:asparagine synthase-related protein [Sphingomonas koreensis]